MTPPVIISPSSAHSATFIFLHGLGDTGHGWASAIAALTGPHIKVICPTAATQPVTLNAGFRMPSWFDLRSLDASGPEDEQGILRATNLIHQLIESEIKSGIPSDRVLLGGFSQGGALAFHSALTWPPASGSGGGGSRLAGVVGLSCWLPRHNQFPSDLTTSTDLPVMQCHGDCDPIVPYKWGQMTSTYLKALLSNTEFRTYRGLMHSSSDAEMQDIRKFIARTVGDS